MARLKGILKIKGTLDDLTFYKSGSDYLVRTKGGVDGDRIANDPNFQRTRENGSEFGAAASSGKLLRTAVRNLMTNAKDRLVTSRLTKVMTLIKNFDTTSARGSRNVGVGIAEVGAKAILKGFNFNIKSILSSIFFAPYALDDTTGEVTITGLTPINDIVAPSGATHVALKAGWTRVNFVDGSFDTQISPPQTLPLDGAVQNVTLTPPAAPSGTGTDVYLMHMEFYQEVNGQMYSLKNGAYNSLGILEVSEVVTP